MDAELRQYLIEMEERIVSAIKTCVNERFGGVETSLTRQAAERFLELSQEVRSNVDISTIRREELYDRVKELPEPEAVADTRSADEIIGYDDHGVFDQ